MIKIAKFIVFLLPGILVGAGCGFRWAWKAAKEPFYLETAGTL